MELSEFITARLDEDERIALEAAEGENGSPDWHVDAVYEDSGSAGVRGANGLPVVSDEGFPAIGEAEHIARYDPARALRDVEAGRRILERHRDCVPYGGGLCDHAGIVDLYAGPCPDMRDLLARWDDHPGYDPAWRMIAEGK